MKWFRLTFLDIELINYNYNLQRKSAKSAKKFSCLTRYELAKVEVERGKFLLAEDDLIKQEQQLAKEKTEMALARLKKEERKARMAEKNLVKMQR